MGRAPDPHLRGLALTLQPVRQRDDRIIGFVTERLAIHSILSYLGEPTAAPGACPGLRSEVAPARGPPLWEFASFWLKAYNSRHQDVPDQSATLVAWRRGPDLNHPRSHILPISRRCFFAHRGRDVLTQLMREMWLWHIESVAPCG